MKKSLIYLLQIVVFMAICSVSYSQNEKETKPSVKPALLVIDIQNAYLEGMDVREKDQVMNNINLYIQYFRSQGFPIIRIYHYNSQYGPAQGTDKFEFPASVLIKPEDPKVIKTYPDGFNKTDLDKVLKEKGVNTLFLCGLSSVGCVLSTWVGAHNYDYKAFLVKDAIMSHNKDYTDNIETMFDAVGFEVISALLSCASK